MSTAYRTSITTAPDGTELCTYTWEPKGEPRAIVQIAHGMAEHAGRYDRLAQRLTDEGYVVYAHDHRGHGGTAIEARDHGYFADEDGWWTVVDDIRAVGARAQDEHPGLRRVLLGHSMGSFLSRSYAMKYGDDIDALVLSGTGAGPGLLGKVGSLIATVESKVRGPRAKSTLMNTLSFGEYNKAFKPNRTEFDWLSRDPDEVDAYIADPLCGEVFTTGFYIDMLGGLDLVNDDKNVARVRSDLPIYLFSGSMDPVGDAGKGVKAVRAQFERAGVRDVTMRLYPDGRHEMFNEINRDEVTDDLIDWLEIHLPST